MLKSVKRSITNWGIFTHIYLQFFFIIINLQLVIVIAARCTQGIPVVKDVPQKRIRYNVE